MHPNEKVLSFFKRKNPVPSQAHRSDSIFFQLSPSEGDTILTVVDKKGNPFFPDFRWEKGTRRDILKELHRFQEDLEEFNAWGEPETGDYRVSLKKKSNLLQLLMGSEDLRTSGFEKITTFPKPATLVLHVEEDEEKTVFTTRWRLLQANGDSIPLSSPFFLDQFVLLDGNSLYCLESIGPEFEALQLFATNVPENQIEPFLSILLTAVPEIQLQLDGYECLKTDEIEAKPALVFQELDRESNLFIRIASYIEGFTLEFLEDYAVTKRVSINKSLKRLLISEIDYAASLEAQASLRQDLQKLARKTKDPHAVLLENDDGTWLLGHSLAEVFLKSLFAEIAGKFTLFGTEKLRNYKIVHSRPKLTLNVSHGIDYFDGDGEIEIEGEHFSIVEALKQYRKNRYISLSDGNQAILENAYMDRLERLFKKQKTGVRFSLFDLPAIEEMMDTASAISQLPKARAVFEGFNQLGSRKVPLKQFKGKLRPYQTYGLKWLDYLYENKLGACLADDMGLGKTIQAIALLSRIYPKAKAPTLIVLPKSLIFNWTRELESFAPKLRTAVFYGTQREWKSCLQAQVILTTYGTIRSDIETIATTHFAAVFLDESQAVKNPQTQTAKAAYSLKADFRLALSGTPLENHLGELYALFRFLNPSMFYSQKAFERDYLNPIQRQNDETVAKELRSKINPFILRRIKSEVLKELPPKIEQTLFIELSDEQKSYYDQRRLFYKQFISGEIEKQGIAKSQFIIFEALMELRQLATVPEARTDGEITSSKWERLWEAIEETIENGRKCLVFSNFLAGVEAVSEMLDSRSIGYETMTGASNQREQRVQRFQSDKNCKVFVMTLKTGGVGLNLTAADTVFIIDPWWNTSAESQAVDRVHRIGQTNTVFTYRLIAKGTIEEKILVLQQRKKDILDKIISSDSASVKNLTEADIDLLFND